jgi:N-acetyl-gamma-glutamyl-phosphate reductase
MAKYDVGVVGATGYTGSELLRLLLEHPEINLKLVTSRSREGEPVAEVHPHLEGLTNLTFSALDDLSDYDLDLVFLALPHGASMNFIAEYGYEDFKVIDLSGDFRLKSVDAYEEWYDTKHQAKDAVEDAVYGMPELYRDQIRNAQLVANPGCYPTASTLALAPLIHNDYIEAEQIVVDAKSGVTGAGATPKESTHFPDVFGNFSAYGLLNHRHTPEIQDTLNDYGDTETELLFTPHLLPIDRGILSTIYTKPKRPLNTDLVREAYLNFYEKEHFVRVMDEPPSIKNVRGSNYCDIFATYDERTERILTISCIDNLVKGAAGQAVQNMNLMFGLIERSGLKIPPLNP